MAIATYTSQSDFNAATNSSTLYQTNPDSLDGQQAPNPITIGPATFTADAGHEYFNDGAYPKPYLGASTNSENLAFSGDFHSVSFDLGSYDGPDTVGISINGQTAYTLNTTYRTSQFIGFTDSDPISSISFSYGTGELDFLDFTTGQAGALAMPAPVYSISASPQSGIEGTAAGSGTPFTYTVTRTDASQAGLVDLSFGGTATPPGGTGTPDYTIASGTGTYASSGTGSTGTLSFTAGQSTATFVVTSTPDAIYEPDETVIATLSDVASGGGTIGTANAATATIQNDDTAPSLAISPANVTHPEGNSGTTAFTYTVTRTGDAQANETVQYAVTGSNPNPATADDFTGGAFPSGTVTFTQGQATQTITVPVMGDTTVEPDENFTVTLSNPNFGTIAQATATGTVQNDDVAPAPPPSPIGGGGSDPTPTPTPAGPSTGDDNLVGTDGPDSISLLAGNDTYSGLGGNDLIYGNQGNDLVYGNQGDDTLFGGMDQDTLYGGQGRDVIYGNKGDDVAYGNLGNDTLFGGMGNDTLFGGMGDDVLFGGKGDDVLVGGLGSDTFAFNPGDTDFMSGVGTGDTIADFVTGTDKIDFTAGPAATAQNFGSGSVAGGSFAQLQAAAQTLITGGAAYVFETNGTDGFLFTTGGSGQAITDAVKLAGANTAASVAYTDIHAGTVA